MGATIERILDFTTYHPSCKDLNNFFSKSNNVKFDKVSKNLLETIILSTHPHLATGSPYIIFSTVDRLNCVKLVVA
jgi:hypothetical protein